MAAEMVEAAYMGFTFQITERSVTVLLNGYRLGVVPSVKQARLFVRGYRRGDRRMA